MTGEARIGRGGSSIEVSLEGGFLPDVVYRITVLPRFQDRYQNRMAAPYDLIFSTGPDISSSLIAGRVESRLTLEGLAGVRVDANTDGGEFPYSAITDSTGVFTFPHLPQGRYTLVAYQDENRNRQPDFAEAQESLAVGLNDGDTLIVTELAILEPDTTAAVLVDVALQDSLGLVLTFDYYIDPAAALDEVVALLSREGAHAPELSEVVHPHIWRARSAAATPTPSGPPLPSQEILLRLSRPLLAGVTYRLEVTGVVNLREVPGGGGEAEVDGPAVTPELPSAAGAGPGAAQNPPEAAPDEPPPQLAP
jgi:hypothetical protein